MRNKSTIGRQRWLRYTNSSGSTIPAFGILKITGADTDGVLTADDPTADKEWLHCVNYHHDVLNGAEGSCTFDYPTFALYDTGDGTPAVDELWSPDATDFKLHKVGSGTVGNFPILGGVGSGRVLIGPPYCDC